MKFSPMRISAYLFYIVDNKRHSFNNSKKPWLQTVTLVEWLTRGPASKLGRAFGRVGSNPAGDENSFFLFFSTLEV